MYIHVSRTEKKKFLSAGVRKVRGRVTSSHSLLVYMMLEQASLLPLKRQVHLNETLLKNGVCNETPSVKRSRAAVTFVVAIHPKVLVPFPRTPSL